MTRAWVRRSVVATLALSAATALLPRPARGQFRAPCEVQCALTLGATAYVAGTSALVAWGRASGGVSTSKEAALVWGTGFAIVAGGGVALGGNGARQERAIYGAGLGTLAGTVAGFAVGLTRSSSLPGTRTARLVAATLIGAGVGALAGGVYGALTHDPASPIPIPLFAVRWRP